jgi:TolA-binding protein
MPTDNDEPTPEPIELRRFDLHSLWRVLLWGSSAAMALAVVAGTAFSDIGSDRLKQTIASILEPAKLTAPVDTKAQQIAALEQQTRDLMQTVRDLTTERDQVKTRLATLEQSLEDITGAVKKQSAQLATQQRSTDSPKPAAPAVSAPPIVAATTSPQSTSQTTPAPQATASTSKESHPTSGPPPAIARVASAAPTATAKPEGVTEPAPVTRKEMGIDIGGAATLEALRAHWAGIKANAGPDLVGLQPAFTIRHKANASPDYRLILGPFPNGTTALRVCAKLALSHIPCRAGTYTVQQLAER